MDTNINEDIFDSISADIAEDVSTAVELVRPELEYETIHCFLFPKKNSSDMTIHDENQKILMMRFIYRMITGNEFPKYLFHLLNVKTMDSPSFEITIPNTFYNVHTVIQFFYYVLKMMGDEIETLVFSFRNDMFLPVDQAEEQILNNNHFRSVLKDHLFNKHRYISKKLYTKILIPVYGIHLKDAVENYLDMSLDDYAIRNIMRTYRWKDGLDFIEYDEEQSKCLMTEGANHMSIHYLNDYNICTHEISSSDVRWMRNFMSHGDFYKVRWFKFIGFDVTTKQNSHTAMFLCLVTHPLFNVETINMPFFKVAFWSEKKKIRDYSIEDIIARLKKMKNGK